MKPKTKQTVNPVQGSKANRVVGAAAKRRAVGRTGGSSPSTGAQVVALSPRQETDLQFIERVMKDPAFDPAKFNILMEWRARELAVLREEQFNVAMNAAQAEMTQIAADAYNEQTQSKYATYTAFDRALRPHYTKHGLSISYTTSPEHSPDHVRVIAIVRCGKYTAPPFIVERAIVTKGFRGTDMMTLVHAEASAETYARRALLAMIFGIGVDKDDDGNDAGKVPVETINEEQTKQLQDRIATLKETEARFCKLWKIKSISDLPTTLFDEALRICDGLIAKKTSTA